MNLHLDFEPHSYYMGFAIQDYRQQKTGVEGNWAAYTDNGNTYRIDMLECDTLKGLKAQIRAYHLKAHDGYGERIAKRRLEYLRGEILAERISTGEIAELQALVKYIQPDDTLLLEWAGVPDL